LVISNAVNCRPNIVKTLKQKQVERFLCILYLRLNNKQVKQHNVNYMKGYPVSQKTGHCPFAHW